MSKDFEFFATPLKTNSGSVRITIPKIIVKTSNIVIAETSKEGKIYKFVLRLEED